MNHFGKLLALYRVERMLSQPELAKLCGLSPSTINRLESGRLQPSVKVIRQLIRGMFLSASKSESLYWSAQFLPPNFLLVDGAYFEASRDFYHDRLEEAAFLSEETVLQTSSDRFNPQGSPRQRSVISYIRQRRLQSRQHDT